MARRKDPAAAVIEFFETATPDAAETVLGICKAIVARRNAGKPKPRSVRAQAAPESPKANE